MLSTVSLQRTVNKVLCKLALLVFDTLKGITSGLKVKQVFAVTKVYLTEGIFLIISL